MPPESLRAENLTFDMKIGMKIGRPIGYSITEMGKN